MFIKTLSLLLTFCCAAASADSYKSHPVSSSENVIEFKKVVERITETKNEILILFEKDPLFYSFPKQNSSDHLLKDFLNQSVKSKKPIKVKLLHPSGKVVSISDK